MIAVIIIAFGTLGFAFGAASRGEELLGKITTGQKIITNNTSYKCSLVKKL